MKKGMLALCLALILSACAPRAGTDPSPAPVSPTARPLDTVIYLGNAADPLSATLFGPLERWAEETRRTYVGYDCGGHPDTQTKQVEELVHSRRGGVVVLYPVAGQAALDRAAEDLYRAGYRVITLAQEAGSYAKRYVSCHIGADREEMLRAAARMVNQAMAYAECDYLRLSDRWPDSREAVWEKALSPHFTCANVGYTAGQRDTAQSYIDQIQGEYPGAAFLFAFSQSGALGAADALEAVGREDLPVYAVSGDWNGLRHMAQNPVLAGMVVYSPALLRDAVLAAIPQVAQGTRLPNQRLAPTIVTQDSLEDVLAEYR